MAKKVDQAEPLSRLPGTFELISFDGNARTDLLDEIGMLRVHVWEATGIELTLPLVRGRWLDEADQAARHFAVRHNGKIVAASRLSLYREFAEIPDAEWYSSMTALPSFPIAAITRLVVAPEYQHQGLGRALDEECIATARNWSAGCVFCDVPEYRIGPLSRRGFKIIQEPKLGIRFPTVRWTAMILDLQQKKG